MKGFSSGVDSVRIKQCRTLEGRPMIVVYQLETCQAMLYFHGKTAIFANLKFP